MRLPLPGGPHLAYCLNIHPGESWAEARASLLAHVPRVRELLGAAAPGGPFGVGLRLSARAAGELAEPGMTDELRALLEANDLYAFTVNAFPYGRFHGGPVKERVYAPDWRDPARLAYTDTVARLLASLLPENVAGSVSTVPCAFKSCMAGEADARASAAQLVRHAALLARLEEDTGRAVTLALEPEPCCFLETTAEAVRFFEEYLFAAPAREIVAGELGVSAERAEGLLHRHLGLCWDVCHGAVQFEEPREALALLERAGIAVAKVQLSAALRVPRVDVSARELLAPFDDGVYLHQTVQRRGGQVTRFADLPQAFAALDAGAAGGEWRVHCHVPLFAEPDKGLTSTRDAAAEVLEMCREQAVTSHLEIETYTWDVLPQGVRGEAADVDAAIAQEYAWVLGELGISPG